MPWSWIKILSDFFTIPYAMLLVFILPIILKKFEIFTNLLPVSIPNLYFTALAYTFTIIFYRIFCPEIMKDVKNGHGFIKNKQKILSSYSALLDAEVQGAQQLSKHIEVLQDIDAGKRFELPKEVQKAVKDHVQAKIRSETLLIKPILSDMKHISASSYEKVNIERKIPRYIATFLILIYLSMTFNRVMQDGVVMLQNINAF